MCRRPAPGHGLVTATTPADLATLTYTPTSALVDQVGALGDPSRGRLRVERDADRPSVNPGVRGQAG